MTTPAPVQKKTKAWIALIGSALTWLVPQLLEYKDFLPQPWPMIIGAVFGILTALGVFKGSNAPKGTVLTPVSVTNPDGTYDNPYRAS